MVLVKQKLQKTVGCYLGKSNIENVSFVLLNFRNNGSVGLTTKISFQVTLASAVLYVNSNFHALVCFQRRSSLEEWMTKLLSDIDVSRSVPVASFLELEAAARSCMSVATMLLSFKIHFHEKRLHMWLNLL